MALAAETPPAAPTPTCGGQLSPRCSRVDVCARSVQPRARRRRAGGSGRRERGQQRRETGRAADASTPGETHSRRVKYGERGRAGRAGASGVRVSSDEAPRAATGGRCGARGGRGGARPQRLRFLRGGPSGSACKGGAWWKWLRKGCWEAPRGLHSPMIPARPGRGVGK